MQTTLIIPDLHCPWQHPGAVDFLADVARECKPGNVLCVGDEIDAYRWSSYDHSPESPGPTEELRLARAALAPLYKLFPRVSVCRSNHVYRPYKRAREAGLSQEFLREVGDVLAAPRGWKWAEWWNVGRAIAFHGDGFSGKNAALSAAQNFRRSVVMGHVHAFAGVQFSCGPVDQVWGLNVGCLIDQHALAFEYARHNSARPVLGCGIVDGETPLFIPFGG